MKISTKDLYLIKLVVIKKYDRNYIYFEPGQRWALAHRVVKVIDHIKSCSDDEYIDIFTGSRYFRNKCLEAGQEYVKNATVSITDKEYITDKEAKIILERLNPTCFHFVPEKAINNNKISTNNLCIVFFDNNIKSLAWKVDNKYIDVFTGSLYNDNEVSSIDHFVSTSEYITKEQAQKVLFHYNKGNVISIEKTRLLSRIFKRN